MVVYGDIIKTLRLIDGVGGECPVGSIGRVTEVRDRGDVLAEFLLESTGKPRKWSLQSRDYTVL